MSTNTTQKPRKMIHSLRNSRQNYWVEYQFSSQQAAGRKSQNTPEVKSMIEHNSNTFKHYKFKTVMIPIADSTKGSATSLQTVAPSKQSITVPTILQTNSTTTTTLVVDERLSLQYILNKQ